MKGERLPNWLKQRARLTPERIALETEQKALTFFELEERSAKLAHVLSEKGVKKGARVAFIQGNTPELVVSYHAVSYLEAVAVPLNIRLTVSELSWQIKDSEAQIVLYDERHNDRVQDMLDVFDDAVTFLSISSLLDEAVHAGPFSPIDEWDQNALHTIIYTSGTTGYPKGVRLTYGNHWWSAIGSALNLGLSSADHWLCVVPLFHVSGLSILMKSLIYGMKMTLLEKFDASEVNRRIEETGVTHISVVGAMLQAMLEDPKFVTPSHLRCVLLGGGPAPLPLLNKCTEKGMPVFQTYGLSETASQIVTLAPEYMISKLGSAGRPLFPAQIRIIKDGENLGPDQEGEILVKGPNVTEGYDHLPEATEAAFEDGWLHTGDMGRLDQEGFLYVLDRRKDMIVSGGENIYPAEVESVLLGHPDVKEAGVIGIPDDRWGSVPVGFVVLREGTEFNQEQFLQYCEAHLARYKLPRQLFQIEGELPRNASRKLLRRKLVALLPEYPEKSL